MERKVSVQDLLEKSLTASSRLKELGITILQTKYRPGTTVIEAYEIVAKHQRSDYKFS